MVPESGMGSGVGSGMENVEGMERWVQHLDMCFRQNNWQTR